ncbi:UNVERIFIED_CONTAM: hypothetical protein FKN15_063208 [Acipenser sinensis]
MTALLYNATLLSIAEAVSAPVPKETHSMSAVPPQGHQSILITFQYFMYF